MDLFFILVALALLIAGIYMIVRGSHLIGAVVVVFAVVVFLLKDTLASESDDVGSRPTAVVVF